METGEPPGAKKMVALITGTWTSLGLKVERAPDVEDVY